MALLLSIALLSIIIMQKIFGAQILFSAKFYILFVSEDEKMI